MDRSWRQRGSRLCRIRRILCGSCGSKFRIARAGILRTSDSRTEFLGASGINLLQTIALATRGAAAAGGAAAGLSVGEQLFVNITVESPGITCSVFSGCGGSLGT
jgi:hypothetical protein